MMKKLLIILILLPFVCYCQTGGITITNSGSPVTLTNSCWSDILGDVGILADIHALDGVISDKAGLRTITNTAVTVTEFNGVNCMEFNGSTSKLDLGSEFIGVTDITVLAWIYPRSYGENIYVRIIDNGKFLFFVTGVSNALAFSSIGSTPVSSANSSISLNRWYNTAVTRTTNGTANFYITAVSSGTVNLASGTPVAGTTNVIIGNNNAQNRTFDGYIARVVILNRILTADERTLFYTHTKPNAKVELGN